MKNKFQSFEDGMRMAGGSIQHPLSIHSASIGTCRRHRVWQVLMTLVFLFTLSIGQMWGADTVFKCKLNGSVVQERNDGNEGDFFSFSFSSGSYSWKESSDVAGCTYDGVAYTSALKFDSKPTLSFTTTEKATIIVVQSTSKNSSKAPKFDGTAMTSKTEITGANVWTITDVTAGDHNVRYSSEIWIHCVYVIYPDAGGGCTEAPAAPTKFEAGSITENGVTFTITDAADAASYDIYYSTSNTAPEATTAANATSTAKTKAITGLTASTEYFAWVRSVCDDTHKSTWVALTGGSFTTSAPDPCTTHHWFVATADATANGKTNWDGFTNAVTGSSGQTNSVTIDGTTYNLTKRTGSTTGTDGIILGFTIPANKAGILYGYMKSSGSAARTLSLKKGDDVVKTNTEITDGSWTLITIDAIAPGTYTLSPDQNVQVQMFVLKICDATFRTITLEYADGTTPDGSLSVLDGTPATKPADPTWAHHRFDGWFKGADNYDWTANVTSDFTLTAHWTQLYTITYAAGDGTATGDAPTQVDKAAGETFKVAANTFAVEGKDFDKWNDGTNDYNPDDTYTVGTENVVLTAQWKAASAKYTVIFKDGDTELGTKLFEVGSNPSDAEIDKTKPLFTFAAWQKDEADIALDAEFWATVVKDATVTLTARWTKVYAQSIDMEQFVIDNTKAGNWHAYLDSKGYAYASSNMSLDSLDGGKTKNNYQYLGLKFNKNSENTYVEGNLQAQKLMIVKVGAVGNNTYMKIDGAKVAEPAIVGGVEADSAAAYTYWYYDTDKTFSLFHENGGTSMLKGITITDPFTVTFDANGGDDVASLNGTPSVMLPLPTKGTESFLGWFDGETKVGEAGESYTPTANITLVAHWEAVSTDARLASISFSSDAGTLEPAFDPEVVNYTYTMPYGTAAIPTITGATSVSAKAQDPIIGEVAAAWGDAQTIKGVAQSGDKKTYTITMAKAPKDGVVIIHADIPSGTSADYAATGLYAGTGNSKNEGSSLKLGDNHYAGVTLTGGEIFKEGDILNIHVKTINGFVKAPISTTNAVDGSGVIFTEERSFVVDDNFITLTSAFEDANSSSLYLVRTTTVGAECNPAVDYIEVTRAMNPVLTAITIDDRAGVIDEANKTVAVTIPYEAVLSSLTVVPTIVRNAAHATTPEAVISNEGAWIEGDNTYRVMDKDGDYTDYTITLTRDVLKHTVSFNTHGGSAVASVEVEDGKKLTADQVPADPTKAENEFQGWAETADGAIVDVTSFTITAAKEFHAVWAAEPEGIKLFSNTGELNTTNFISPAKTTIEIDDVEHVCLAEFGSNRDSDLKGATPADMVKYDVTTDKAKIKMTFYNNNSGVKKAILYKYEEGGTPEKIEIEVPGQEIYTTEYYEFNSSKNRTFYVCMKDRSNIRVLQVKVVDNGANPVKQFGEVGYSLNLNKARFYAKDDVEKSFEGFTFTPSSEYKVYNNNNLQTKIASSFNVPAKAVMSVKRSGGKYYVYQDPEDKGTLYSADAEIELNATGTWYISSETNSSAVSFTKIEFLAPKCEKPTITPMSNSDLCEGDAFAALNVSASVSDEGTLHYQWYKVGEPDAAVGTDAASFTPEADGEYYVIVTNRKDGFSDNSATSNTITVTHFAAAVITTAPLNKRGEVGDVVTLTVAAIGKNVAYKWYTCDEDGSNEVALDPEETNASLNVTVTAGMAQWYKVKVTSDCGNTEAMAKVSVFVPTTPANVTNSILWDWTDAAWPASGTAAFTNEASEDYELLADADAIVPNVEGFRSDMLYGKGQYVWRSGNKFFQGTAIKFTSTVAGKVRVNFRSTGSGKTVNVAINGTAAGSRTNSFGWSSYVEVPAGEVEILCSGDGYTRIQQIEFLALAHQRTSGYNVGDLGTVCLEDSTFIEGASLYELAGLDEHGYLAFDEISTGELEAGKPYLFEVINPNKISFYKPIGAAHSDTEIETNGMIGTFAGTTLYQNAAQNYYYFSGRHIWRVNDFTVSIDIPAHRCYVDMDELQPVAAAAPAPGRRRVTLGVQGSQVVTGMENLNAGDQPVKVMINGQLFILRGEKMYDATGKLVK